TANSFEALTPAPVAVTVIVEAPRSVSGSATRVSVLDCTAAASVDGANVAVTPLGTPVAESVRSAALPERLTLTTTSTLVPATRSTLAGVSVTLPDAPGEHDASENAKARAA